MHDNVGPTVYMEKVLANLFKMKLTESESICHIDFESENCDFWEKSLWLVQQKLSTRKYLG